MKFARFSAYSFLSNWGSYSPKENALLAKEREVGMVLAELEPFVLEKQLVRNLNHRFRRIQLDTAVDVSKYDSLMVELDRMAKEAKDLRIEVLNRGGADIPDAPETFQNHQPDALVGEIRNYLAQRKLMRESGLGRAFVIHYQADLRNHDAVNFHAEMDKCGKVLYTVDIDKILSIGDPASAKHSVVAVGKDCIAAGIAQLEIDDRTDLYLSFKDHQGKADEQKRMIAQGQPDPRGELKENMQYNASEASRMAKLLKGWVPPLNPTKTVVLDFDSGHYAPSKAWKEAMAAWANAGYKAKWSGTSRRV